jgi:hypothetical protein
MNGAGTFSRNEASLNKSSGYYGDAALKRLNKSSGYHRVAAVNPNEEMGIIPYEARIGLVKIGQGWKSCHVMWENAKNT